MREILFRGKRLNGGEWIYGPLVSCTPTSAHIASPCFPDDDGVYNLIQIAPSTVGQYTGLKDKNGKRIFEGDVVSAFLDDMAPANETRGVIAFEDYGWVIRFQDGVYDIIDGSDDGLWTVIGNVHGNPDLLEVE